VTGSKGLRMGSKAKHKKPEYDALIKCLVWRKDALYWTCGGGRKGRRAGTVDRLGYIRVKFEGKFFLGHRIHWYMKFGTLPDQLDHINGVKHDNRIENLRPASTSQNCHNKKAPRKNRSAPYRGVSIRKYVPEHLKILKKKGNPWRAMGSINGKKCCLGHYNTALEAAFAYDDWMQERGLDKWGLLNFPERYAKST